MAKVHELKKEISDKQKLVTEKREALEKYRGILETRDLTEEETRDLDAETAGVAAVKADIEALKARVDKLEQFENEDKAEDAVEADSGRSLPAVHTRSRLTLEPVQETNYLATREYKREWMNHMMTGNEIRATSFLAGTPAQGGYALAPVSVYTKIITTINNLIAVKKLVTKIPVKNSLALRVPKLTTDIGLPAYGTEGNCISPDLTGVFGYVDLTPSLMSILETISLTLVQAGGDTFVNFISDRLAYKFASVEEAGILTGPGTGGTMLGVFTASANGVPTTQDVATAAAGVLTADDLINTVAFLNPYVIASPNAAWVMHPTTLAYVRKLKDTQGRYLLEPSLQAGMPDQVLGIKVISSAFAPAYSNVSGSYVAVLGDFAQYFESEYDDAFSIQRLSERFAECSILGIMGRRWVGGAPVNPAAFARTKIT